MADIVFDAANPSALYAADRMSGDYRSIDGGVSWQTINEGLRMRGVNQLTLDGTWLYAATAGEGVYRLEMEK